MRQNIPISIDTFYSSVAEEAIKVGTESHTHVIQRT
jgi:dihydropteroate synthase